MTTIQGNHSPNLNHLVSPPNRDVDVDANAATIEEPKMALANFEAQFDDAIAAADLHAPTLAANLKRMIDGTPDALPLYLANLNMEHQRELTSASAKLSSVSGTGSKGLLQGFEKVLKNASDTAFTDNQDVLAKYTKYMVALSELITKINAQIKPEEDGKSNLNGTAIYQQLRNFTKNWAGSDGKIASFTNKKEADALANRFRGGTAVVIQDGSTFTVRFDLSRLSPILNSIFDPEANVSNIGVDVRSKDVLPTLIKALKEGKALPDTETGTGINPHWTDLRKGLRGSGMNSHSVQSVSLATGDVQKTHQTDLDLLLNEFSRTNSQFDNLVKLYSSLVTALTETCKSAL